jgi:endoglucanase
MKTALTLAALLLASTSVNAAPLFGINWSGMEFNSGALPGRPNTDYPLISPPLSVGATANVIRIPFLMERVFPNGPGGAVDAQYLASLVSSSQWALANSATPIVDEHGYGGVFGNDITTPAGASALANAWAALAKQLPVGTGADLMNEPIGQTNTALAATYNGVIQAMRAVGFGGTIFVEPRAYARADQVKPGWTDFDSIVDPQGDTDLEVHWYLDPNNNGQGGDPPNATIGSAAMQNIVAWKASTTSHLGLVFLGETGVGQSNGVVDAASIAALNNELKTIAQHGETFFGATLWAAGPWWPASYALNVNAVNGAVTGAMTVGENVFFPLQMFLAADSYQGDPAYSIKLDGKVVAAGAVSNNRLTTAPLQVGVPNSGISGSHTATVTFLNDTYAGTPTTDRNLFLMGASLSGAILAYSPQTMLNTGSSATVTFKTP